MNPWVKHWMIEGTSQDKRTGKPKQYKVSQRQDGTFGCECPAHKFQKGTKNDCQHILKVKLSEQITTGVQKVVQSNFGITSSERKFKDI